MDLLEVDDEAGRTVTSTLLRPRESGEAMRAEEELCEEAWAAMCASSSCSCCRALTNAAFSRFVCSAFRAFFTLVVTHCSHITLTSLPAKYHCINYYL